MKAPVILCAFILLCLTIALVQRSELSELKSESAKLEASTQTTTTSSRRSREPTRSSIKEQSTSQDPAITAKHIQAILDIYQQSSAIADKWRNPATRTPELIEELKASIRNEPSDVAAHYAALDYRSALELIATIRADESISELSKEDVEPVCVARLTETNPSVALQLILTLDNLENRESLLTQAFTRWSIVDPNAAIQWFNEQSQTGDPSARNSKIVQQALVAQAGADADQALSRTIAEVEENPATLANLGATIAASLKNEQEHIAFLAAMRRKSASTPDSESLQTIRTDYVRELTGRLDEWTFEDATSLIDSEFSPIERTTVADRIAHNGDLAEPSRWATWISKIDFPPTTKHPLHTLIISWAHTDPAAAGKWLEQAPQNPLKNKAIVEYAFQVADHDPASAARWSMTLPDGPQRDKILRQVVEKWNEQDPKAAAAFAKTHSLPE